MNMVQSRSEQRQLPVRKTFPELSYDSPTDPILKQRLIRAVERFSRRDKFVPVYNDWRETGVSKSNREMSELPEMLDADILERVAVTCNRDNSSSD